MISTATGNAVLRLVEDARSSPERYSRLVVCSPFVDEELSKLVAHLAHRTLRVGCSFRVITRPASAATILAALPANRIRWKGTIYVNPAVHAKVYLAASRAGRVEAIVTSANLTAAGVTSDLELGIHAMSTSAAGRQLVDRVRYYLERLLAFEANPWNPNLRV